jgi:mRNA interferase MazF
MVETESYVPQRGDLIWITLNPQAGYEQSGRRPAVVLSPGSYNKRVGLAILCPITRQIKGYPFEVPIPKGLPINGVILSDHVKNLDWRARNAELICELPDTALAEALQKLGTLLAFE